MKRFLVTLLLCSLLLGGSGDFSDYLSGITIANDDRIDFLDVSDRGSDNKGGGYIIYSQLYEKMFADIQTDTLTNLYVTTLDAGRIALDNSYHVFGGFQDSAVTITIDSVDVWRMITNAGGNLWGSDEYDGLLMSGDTMTIVNGGDYVGSVSFTLDGGNQKDFQARIYNVTQAREEGYHIGESTTGANNYANFTLPIYVRATAGDELVLQIRCTTDDSDPRIKSAIFYMAYLHE